MAEFNYNDKRYSISDDKVQKIALHMITNFSKLNKEDKTNTLKWLSSGMKLSNSFKKAAVEKNWASLIGNAVSKTDNTEQISAFNDIEL